MGSVNIGGGGWWKTYETSCGDNIVHHQACGEI